MTKHVCQSEFDFGYRPASYFEDLDRNTLIVASIFGEERRKDVQDRLESGDFDPIVWGEWLTETKLDESTRELIGRVHPAFMGGEYLPDFREDEIEIARIICASVTQDVTSIRARRSGKRISYRIVDEHENKFIVSKKSSPQSLTMQELIDLINGSKQLEDEKEGGIIFSIMNWNLENVIDPSTLRGFISVASSFYPELARYYAGEIDRYVDGFLVKNEEEEGA